MTKIQNWSWRPFWSLDIDNWILFEICHLIIGISQNRHHPPLGSPKGMPMAKNLAGPIKYQILQRQSEGISLKFLKLVRI